jgi:hypothetical protein
MSFIMVEIAGCKKLAWQITFVGWTTIGLVFFAMTESALGREQKGAGVETKEHRMLVECMPRGGMPNVLSKLVRGGEVKIAYFGGSITAQSGWRVQSLAYFRKTYPKARIEEINAAIGGTGSNLGVYRLDRDVLRHKPDLLFVEFAVNDSGTDPAEIVRSMEGIVRKTWKQLPQCDICFVYTMTKDQLPELREGKLFRSAVAMEQVADHYLIPSIFMGTQVVELEKQGKLIMCEPQSWVQQVSGSELDRKAPLPVNAAGKVVFSPDGVHPYNDTGHRLYMEAILRSLPKIQAGSGKPGAHVPGSPIMEDNLENTVTKPMDWAKMTGAWTKLPNALVGGQDFSQFLPNVWRAEPGAELSFRFKGSRALIYDFVGPDGGRLEVTVDGQVSKPERIDGFCTYQRLALLPVCDSLDPKRVHTVRIRLLADRLDKKKILFPSNHQDLIDHPEKYKGISWYAGAIFLAGEGVEVSRK